MKHQLYQAKVQSIINQMVTASERYIKDLALKQDKLDLIWSENNLRLQDNDHLNAGKLKSENEKDHQWLQLVEQNQQLELQISKKLLKIKEKNQEIPEEVTQFTKAIIQTSHNQEQLLKDVKRQMTQEVMQSAKKLKNDDQDGPF